MDRDNTQRPARNGNNMHRRKKVCVFCAEKATAIDYKDVAKLHKFISERSKILPSVRLRRLSSVHATSRFFLSLRTNLYRLNKARILRAFLFFT